MKISVVGGVIRVGHFKFTMSGAQRIVCMVWLIQMTLLRAKAFGRTIPDVELVAQTNDGSQSTVADKWLWDNPGPLFANIKCGNDASVSFPMGFHDEFGARASGAMSLRMYEENWENLLLSAKTHKPWSEKVGKCFFSAGKQTGKKAAAKRGFRHVLFETKDELLDVRLEEYPLSKYAEFKYLVYAHGRCGWSRRIRELAFMDTTILLEASNCTEYYLSKLKANEDFVPVKEDFSDLAQKLQWAHKNQEESKRIAQNWVLHARSIFSLPCVLDYVETLLTQYASLQRFQPIERSEWKKYDLLDPDAHTIKFLLSEEAQLDVSECPGIASKRENHKMTC